MSGRSHWRDRGGQKRMAINSDGLLDALCQIVCEPAWFAGLFNQSLAALPPWCASMSISKMALLNKSLYIAMHNEPRVYWWFPSVDKCHMEFANHGSKRLTGFFAGFGRRNQGRLSLISRETCFINIKRAPACEDPQALGCLILCRR